MVQYLKSIFSVLLFSLTISFSQASAILDVTTRNYDQKHIKLFLTFSFEEGKVNGEEEFIFSPLADDFKQLVLHSKTTVVHSVKINQQELKFTQDEDHLYIDMNKSYSAEDELTIKINYSSYPSRGMYFFHPTEEIPEIPYQIWTQGQDNYNRHWYPAYDLPDDKLTSELIITVPENFKALSNGILDSEVRNNNGTITFHWKMYQPYSNYLTSVIVGEFYSVNEIVRGSKLEYNMPPDWKDNVEYTYGRTPNMMNFFSNYIVPYPYERYAQTSVQDFEWGGMENVTSTTLNRRIHHTETAVPNFTPDDLIAHELAHQWFGDYLTCKTWDHIWLNEGFATYFTDLWIENEYGRNNFLLKRLNQNNEYFKALGRLDTIKQKVDEKIPAELSGRKAYVRGAAILNMLRFILGNEAFNNGIRKYVTSYKNSNVTSEDFRNVLQDVSGVDLSEFFNQWVYAAGFPEFRVSYSWNQSRKKLLLNVEQTQKHLPAVGIFTTPVLVEIIAGKERIIDTILVTVQKESFEFNLTQEPDLVAFNKDMWILCKIDFEKSFEVLSYQLQYDDDPAGRITAAQDLIKFGERAAALLVRSVMRDQFYAVRMEAVESLKRIGGDKSLPGILFAADDKDARVREVSVKALGSFNKDLVKDVLLKKLELEKNDYVRAAALSSIGNVKLENAFNILKESLKINSHRNIIRRGAFEGFIGLQDPSVLPLVREYTKYKYSTGGMHLQDTVALVCAASFADTHYEEAVEVISSALDNPYFRTRNKAAELLADLKAKSKLPLLKNILADERRIVVKEKLQKAISRLSSSGSENTGR